MNNFMNAELGNVISSAVAHNSKFEMTDVIDNDPDRQIYGTLDLLSD